MQWNGCRCLDAWLKDSCSTLLDHATTCDKWDLRQGATSKFRASNHCHSKLGCKRWFKLILTYFDLLPDSPIFRLRWQHCILDCGNFRISPGVTITKQPTCSSIFLAVDGRVAVRFSNRLWRPSEGWGVCARIFNSLLFIQEVGVLDATEWLIAIYDWKTIAHCYQSPYLPYGT